MVNPTWSKVRQQAFEGGPPELAGRPLEVLGNEYPRWMTVRREPVTVRDDRTRRTDRLIRLRPPACVFGPSVLS